MTRCKRLKPDLVIFTLLGSLVDSHLFRVSSASHADSLCSDFASFHSLPPATSVIGHLECRETRRVSRATVFEKAVSRNEETRRWAGSASIILRTEIFSTLISTWSLIADIPRESELKIFSVGSLGRSKRYDGPPKPVPLQLL